MPFVSFVIHIMLKMTGNLGPAHLVRLFKKQGKINFKNKFLIIKANTS